MSAYFARPAAVTPDFYHRSGDRIVLPETAKGREQGLKLLAGLAGYSNPRTVPTKEDPVSEPAGRRPVTVLAARTVQAGREREFESFLSELQDVFAGAPGHLRLTVIRPEPPDREYALVYQFDSQSSLLAWERSDERAAAVARSASPTEHPPRERMLTGLEPWFAAPTGGIVKAPPRWKMWLLSACGIYPIITLITVLAGPLLAPLPAPARFALVTPVLSGLMTWAVMPTLSRFFSRFLYPGTA